MRIGDVLRSRLVSISLDASALVTDDPRLRAAVASRGLFVSTDIHR